MSFLKLKSSSRPNPDLRPMKLTEIDSSMISAAGYDASTLTMRVVFASTGKTVDYLKVPKTTYQKFMESTSKGTFMQNYIINCFEYRSSVTVTEQIDI